VVKNNNGSIKHLVIVNNMLIPPTKKAPHLCEALKFGVADGARTHDNWNHNPGLYQLSYSHHRDFDLACPTGIEPVTPSLEGWCSIRLSYGQI
jgi:hypothetical protein